MQTTLTVLETIFLILSIVVVLAVLAAVVVLGMRILSANRADRKESDSDLQTTDLGKQLTERANRVKRSLMHKKERKELAKRSKSESKTENYDSTVFVVDFRPKLRAREVETLRKEVDVITQLATTRDEVVVRIDSPGGTVTGYGHAASQLLRIHNIGVPLTICVDEIAASGGYMCAAVADKIIAAPFAFIGSIGVVAGIPNFVGLMNKIGVRYFELTAGENKRTLSPFAEPTPEKQAVEQQRLEAIHRAFKQLIKERRPNLDIHRVADGNYWLAVDAKELGLVDMIQTSDEYLLQQAKANRRILKISCERRSHRMLSNLLDSFSAD